MARTLGIGMEEERLTGRAEFFVIPPSYLYAKAETRAEFAERSVAKLEKTIDDLEGKGILPCTPKPL